MDKAVCIRLDEQLIRNYNELYSLIMQCYRDVSILEFYMELQAKEFELYKRLPNIGNHIVRSTQMELALTLWKVYFDKDSKANTIPKFRNSINSKLLDCGNGGKKIRREKIAKDVEEKMNLIRMKFLAHADMTRSNSRIEISDLSKLLAIMCKEFNNICSVIDDERVNSISETKVALQDIILRDELQKLYNLKNCLENS